jgi:hypothetical protein
MFYEFIVLERLEANHVRSTHGTEIGENDPGMMMAYSVQAVGAQRLLTGLGGYLAPGQAAACKQQGKQQ